MAQIKAHEYWLVSYAYLRRGSDIWRYENGAHHGRVTDWIKEMKQYENEGDYRLLFAHPITIAEFKWLDDNL